MKKNYTLYTVLILSLIFPGCKKFLDAKPDKKLVVPSRLEDQQALLDNYGTVNLQDASAGEISADDYYITTDDWKSLDSETGKRMYTWQKDHLFDGSFFPNDWNSSYTVIYYANTVLENLAGMDQPSLNAQIYNNVKGQALYHRAKSYLQAACIWAPAYDDGTSATDLGLPLRLDPNLTIPSKRSSVAETYQQIVADLKAAIPLLPVKATHVMRPSKPAAYGLLARTYLFMRKYSDAKLYADSCLQLYNSLIDFNSLNPDDFFPVPEFNSEVIMHNLILPASPVGMSTAKIFPDFINSYTPEDLRRTIFFTENPDGSYAFRGNYGGGGSLFGGVATDEIYLLRAECNARAGSFHAAMDDLNTLLLKRWKQGSYITLTASSKDEALNIILRERRKELLMRGLRWMDLKRLNKEGAGITLLRTIDGTVFTLPPNDLRYALPIPEDIINLTGMPQNPR